MPARRDIVGVPADGIARRRVQRIRHAQPGRVEGMYPEQKKQKKKKKRPFGGRKRPRATRVYVIRIVCARNPRRRKVSARACENNDFPYL